MQSKKVRVLIYIIVAIIAFFIDKEFALIFLVIFLISIICDLLKIK
jgi:hypothetical protein